MPTNNKKVFQIEINGLTQSVDAVQALNNQLDDLEKRIKRLQNAKVEVKVSDNDTARQSNTVVSGNNSTKNQTNALNELAKLQQQVSRQQAQAEALLTDEYREQLRQKIEISNQNKQATNEIKAQVAQQQVMTKEYANTLAGQRQYLADLKQALANTELNTEEWNRLGNEVLRVNTNVKKMEESYGVFTRNVGNYASAAKGFKELADGTRQYENTINGLTAKLNDLNDTMRNLDVGSEQYRQAQNEIRDLEGQLRELKSGAEAAGNAMEEKLGVRFQTVIGGVAYTFDDVNQGIGLLEDKLYSMAQAGDTTSKEFREIQQEIARLRNSVVSVDAAIDNMIGTSRGLRNVVSILTGFTGIASIGQGLQGLFGSDNADLNEAMQKFTSLSMVMQGVVAIQLEMNQNATAFGQLMNRANGSINSLLNSISNLPLINIFSQFNSDLKKLNENMRLAETIKQANAELGKMSLNIKEISDAAKNLSLKDNVTLGKDNMGLYSVYSSAKSNPDLGTDAEKEFIRVIDEAREKNADFARSFDAVVTASNNARESAQGIGAVIDNLDTRMGRLAAKSPLVAKGINLVAASLRALGKATIILAALQALMWVIEKLGNIASSAWKKIKGAFGDTGDVLDSTKLLTTELEGMREEFDKLAESADKASQSGKNFEDYINRMKGTIGEVGKELGDFTRAMSDAAALSENFSEGNGFWSVGFGGAPDDMEEWVANYQKLMNAVQRGQDRSKAGAGGWAWWNTEADAMEDLANNQRAVIRDLQNEINKIDFEKPEEAMKQFSKLWDDEVNGVVIKGFGDIRKQALENIEQLFPEEAWATNFKALIDAYSSMIEDMKSKNDELVEDTKEMSEEIARQLRDINTYNMQFEPGQWRFGYERQSLKDQYEDERKEAEGNAELLAAIDKKYYNDRQALIRKQAQEIQQVNFEIQQNELDAQKEGLDKRLAQLELSRQQELNAAKQSDINVNEQLASINKKYDAQILAEKEAFYKQQVEAAEERNQAIRDMEQQMLEQDLQMQRQLAQTKNATAGTQLENQNYSVTTTVSYNVETTGGDGLAERKKYYDTLLQYQQDYINQKEKLDLEAAKQSTQTQIEDNQSNYESQLRELDNFFKERQQVLDDNLEQGLVSQEEYNNEMAQLNQMLSERETQLQQQANAQQVALIEQGEAEQTRIMNEANEERLNANSEYLNQMTDSLNDYYSDINSARRSTSRDNTNSLGIINYKKEKENLQNTLKEYNNLMSNIDTEYSNLQQKLNNKEISFNDFKQAKSQLDSLKQKTEESVKQTQTALDNLINTVAGSVMNMVNGYMGAFSDIWSMVSDLRENQLEAEEERLERQQEILDEELEAIEEAYEKQEEVTQSHRDKINDIEGELSTARGDRRQALIDQLTKEREAELKSLKTEQDIQKQKQANEKKQQALEKQQEALDKKRWEQNKQNQIVQATINTFVAVSNALAVQPWFVGLALSAVALSLGLANVAKISAQKYMADGGLLQGKSHAQGGIPVGNTGIVVEGDEFVTNKVTTRHNLPLLEYINTQRRPLTKEDLVNFYDDGKGRKLISSTLTKKYAEGGQLPEGVSNADIRRLVNYTPEQDNRPIVVSVVDIVNASDNLREVQTLAGLE